jgi:hypothetical protein
VTCPGGPRLILMRSNDEVICGGAALIGGGDWTKPPTGLETNVRSSDHMAVLAADRFMLGQTNYIEAVRGAQEAFLFLLGAVYLAEVRHERLETILYGQMALHAALRNPVIDIWGFSLAGRVIAAIYSDLAEDEDGLRPMKRGDWHCLKHELVARVRAFEAELCWRGYATLWHCTALQAEGSRH